MWIGEWKICNNLVSAVTEQALGPPARAYWSRKGRFHDNTISDIDWLATQAAMKAVKPACQRWITKHTSGFCAMGKVMKR